MALETQIISLVVLLVLSAFFSGIETALMSINMIKIKTFVRQKRKGAEALHRIKQNPHKLIVTLLIGNNVVNIGAAALATVLFTNLFGSKGAGIATGVMTFAILVFGEITPKTLAIQHAEPVSLFIARPIEILSIVLMPVVIVFETMSKGISRIFSRGKKDQKLSEEELKTIVTMGFREGILEKETAEIIHNVLEFEGTKVTEVMTPKAHMEIIDGTKSLKSIIDFVVKTPFSRYPVYFKSKNNIIGLLDVDDVLRYTKNNNLSVKIKDIVRPVFFVPEAKEIDDLLTEFETKKKPLCVVVDEYGYVAGLVTAEDILEEIVGDIFDKRKKKTSVFIKKVNKRLIRVDARASVEEINKILHLGIDEEKFNTIAGFIEHKLQKIPKKGEKIKLKGVIIEVDQVGKQKIKSVKITKTRF